jgi:hypothetical protein
MKGRARNGSNAVAVSGKASVIHQIAISTVNAATCHALTAMDAGGPRTSITMKTAMPPHNPAVFAVTQSLPMRADYDGAPK